MKWTPGTQPRSGDGRFVNAPLPDALPISQAMASLDSHAHGTKHVDPEVLSKAAKRFEMGLIWMLNKRPYYGAVLTSMRVVPTMSMDNLMAVDSGMRLYYNPCRIAELENEYPNPDMVVAGLLMHEVNHVIRNHHNLARVRNKDPKLWNYAGDLAINDDLRNAKEIMLPDLIFPEHFDLPSGLTEEEYYDLLVEQQQDTSDPDNSDDDQQTEGNDEQQQQEDSEGSDDQDSGSGGNSGSGNTEDGEPEDSQQDQQPNSKETGNTKQEGDVGKGSCGGCATGADDAELEKEAEAAGKKPKTQFEIDETIQKVADDIVKHGQKNPGDIPAGLARIAKDILAPPQVDWRKVMRTKLLRRLAHGSMGRRSPSFMRPSRKPFLFRRGMPSEVLEPGYVRKQAHIGVVLDTSASMSNEDVQSALAEVGGMLNQTKAQVHLVSCDVASSDVLTLKRKASDISLSGGGGTDMRVGIEALSDKNLDLLVVLTDGYTPWPDQPTDSPMLVGLVHDTDVDPPTVPEWAEKVSINPDYMR